MVRRTITYNRQPRKLAVMPFALAATGLAAYGLWTGSARLLGVMVVVIVAGTLLDGIWWLLARFRGSSAPF